MKQRLYVFVTVDTKFDVPRQHLLKRLKFDLKIELHSYSTFCYPFIYFDYFLTLTVLRTVSIISDQWLTWIQLL